MESVASQRIGGVYSWVWVKDEDGEPQFVSVAAPRFPFVLMPPFVPNVPNDAALYSYKEFRPEMPKGHCGWHHAPMGGL